VSLSGRAGNVWTSCAAVSNWAWISLIIASLL
jgi:hypothetical protein